MIWVISGIAFVFFVLYVSAIRALALKIEELEECRRLLKIVSQQILDQLSE